MGGFFMVKNRKNLRGEVGNMPENPISNYYYRIASFLREKPIYAILKPWKKN